MKHKNKVTHIRQHAIAKLVEEGGMCATHATALVNALINLKPIFELLSDEKVVELYAHACGCDELAKDDRHET